MIDANPAALSISEGPGETLRRGREAVGMSQEALAKELRLTVKCVQALETDDVDKLPEAAYVKGYLRACARILRLDEAELLSKMEILAPREPDWDISQPKINEADTRRKLRLGSVAVSAVLVVLAIVWWFNSSTTAPVQSTALSASASSTSTPQSPATQAQNTNALPPQAPDAAAAQSGELDATLASSTPPPMTDTANEAQASVPILAQDDKPPAVVGDVLELQFVQDSWVDVSDASGQRLLSGLIKAGDVRKLTGESPFKIHLGFAPGVKVLINGELYNHSLHIRRANQSARFTVYAASENL